mmetsp:Transcript_62139/g.189738  ORF Transcript_62139/g.189738 Transcript_62139/m.189738 type:complete len:353 (+) Transcript_62139:4105-5163(+)
MQTVPDDEAVHWYDDAVEESRMDRVAATLGLFVHLVADLDRVDGVAAVRVLAREVPRGQQVQVEEHRHGLADEVWRYLHLVAVVAQPRDVCKPATLIGLGVQLPLDLRGDLHLDGVLDRGRRPQRRATEHEARDHAARLLFVGDRGVEALHAPLRLHLPVEWNRAVNRRRRLLLPFSHDVDVGAKGVRRDEQGDLLRRLQLDVRGLVVAEVEHAAGVYAAPEHQEVPHEASGLRLPPCGHGVHDRAVGEPAASDLDDHPHLLAPQVAEETTSVQAHAQVRRDPPLLQLLEIVVRRGPFLAEADDDRAAVGAASHPPLSFVHEVGFVFVRGVDRASDAMQPILAAHADVVDGC